MKEYKNNRYATLMPLFSKWFYIGLLLLLFGVIVESKTGNVPKEYRYWFSILYELLKSVGIAVLISNVFSFIIGTQNFINFIREKLISIIVSKEFIQKLNKDERRDMLQVILRPTKALSDIYSGINRYFASYISDSLKLFESHYRSSYSINAVAVIEKDKKVVSVEADLNYRIYKVLGEYEKLPIGFEDDNSKVIFTKVTAPGGLESEIDNVELKLKEEIEGEEILKSDPSIVTGSTVQVPEEFKKYNQLDVSRRIIEYGNDHWHLFTCRTSQPCDKLNICLRCDDELEVKKVVIFGRSKSFKVENQIKRVSVTCNDWFEPGAGVAILIGKKNSVQAN